MASENYREKKHLLGKDELAEHASMAIVRSVQSNLPHVEGWRDGALAKSATRIYDLNGTPLFHDYAVKKGRETLGTVRMAASKVLGPPTVAFEVGPRHWSYSEAVKLLRKKLAKKYKTKRLVSTRLICYSYPKLGVLCNMVDKRGKRSRLVFDIASLTRVREEDPSSGTEGAIAWSYYDSLDDKARRAAMKRFDAFDAVRKKVAGPVLRGLRRRPRLATATKKFPVKMNFNIQRELAFCSHYAATEARSHRCFVLHAQQKNDYCAVATCQMVLCYYRHYHSQRQIAPACGYSGGCPADSSAGYETMSNNHIDATYDSSATWGEAKRQLNKLHPMKSGIPGHARACAGYAYTLHTRPYRVTDHKLLIYDPWPWNADYKQGGSVYWEDWNAVNHTNFIYTNLRT